jgi:peroxiredoxin Q/BCP
MLHEGDKAPDFTLASPDGPATLSALLRAPAARYVVLYFYPKDKTPGCTREGQAFSAASADLKKLGAAVFGVSKDSVASHASFAEACGIGVPLLSDPDLTVHKAYGAYGEKTMYGKKVTGTIRSTFIVGKDGTLVRVFGSVKVDGHADAVLSAIEAHATGTPARKTVAKKSVAKKAVAKNVGTPATQGTAKKRSAR